MVLLLSVDYSKHAMHTALHAKILPDGDGQIVSKVVCQRQLSLLLCSAEKGGTGKVPTLTLRYIFIFYLLYSEIRFHYYSFIRERAK